MVKKVVALKKGMPDCFYYVHMQASGVNTDAFHQGKKKLRTRGSLHVRLSGRQRGKNGGFFFFPAALLFSKPQGSDMPQYYAG